MAAEELGDDRQHMDAAEDQRRGDVEHAVRRRAGADRGLLGIVEVGQRRARPRQEGSALVRQPHRSRRAQEELDAEPLLERGDGAGDRLRGEPQPARRGGEAALVGNGEAGGDRVDAVHAGPRAPALRSARHPRSAGRVKA